MKASVDVVIPVYNGRMTICQSITSVLAQKSIFSGRIIVVDDGSTDGTSDSILNMGCAEVELVRTENRGVAAARNLGVELATAEWIAFIDSDDLWEPNKLALQLQAADDYGVGFICGAVSTGAVKLTGPISAISLWRGNFIATSSVLVRREILQHISPPFMVGMPFAEDYLSWLKCLTLCRGYYLSSNLVTYVLSPYPRYRWGQILYNLVRVNILYGAFLRSTSLAPSKCAGLRFLLGLGTLLSFGSILGRFMRAFIFEVRLKL